MNEIARALTDWFNDPTTGIVAKLAALPYDAGDPIPTVGTIADYTRESNVAQDRLPSFPGIALTIREIPFLDGEVQMVSADAIADVLVRIGRKAVDTEIAVRDTGYIVRATIQSWRGFNHDTRVRNQIQMYGCKNLKAAPLWAPVDDAIVTAAIAGHMYFRDTMPF